MDMPPEAGLGWVLGDRKSLRYDEGGVRSFLDTTQQVKVVCK